MSAFPDPCVRKPPIGVGGEALYPKGVCVCVCGGGGYIPIHLNNSWVENKYNLMNCFISGSRGLVVWFTVETGDTVIYPSQVGVLRWVKRPRGP